MRSGEQGPEESKTRGSWRRRLLASAVRIYMTVLLVLWAAQELLLFPGLWVHDLDDTELAARADRAAEHGIVEHRLQRPDGSQLLLWHQPGPGERAILFLHGNGGTVESIGYLTADARALGFDVVAMEFRGFPGCDGWPLQDGLRADVLQTWSWIVDELGIGPEAIVLHGRSLGGGVAGLVLDQVTPAAVVMESTFDSAVAMASASYPMFPVGWLMRSPMRTIDRAPGLGVEVLQVHSRADDVVPFERGQALAAAWPGGARFVAVDGVAHNERLLHRPNEAREAWLALLARVPGGSRDETGAPEGL